MTMAGRHSWILMTALVAIVFPLPATCYRILVLAADSGSHLMMASELSLSLLSRGHEISLVIGSNAKPPSYVAKSSIKLEVYDNPHPYVDRPDYRKYMKQSIFDGSMANRLSGYKEILSITSEACKGFVANQTFISRLKSQKFDYVVVDLICPSSVLLPFFLNLPYSFIVPFCPTWQRSIPTNPAFIPQTNLDFSDRMTFIQRLLNALMDVPLMFMDVFMPVDKSLLPSHLTDLTAGETMSKADLCLTLRNNILDFTRPMMPDVISMATDMARPAHPLPAELDTFMNSSRRGVVLVSFGSVMPELPDPCIQELVDGFKKIPYDIIFKYKGPVPPLPANVRLMRWMPQNDLLAHPNLRVFVTHAGYNSLIEAAYHGVPLVLAPFTFDQPHNAAVARSKGIGEVINIAEIQAESFKDVVVKVIETPTYLANVRKLSAIFREVSKDQGTSAAFWIEHVIKYGASHLRPRGMELPWYQYLLLDVYGVILLGLVLLTLAVKLFVKTAFRVLRMLRRKDKKE